MLLFVDVESFGGRSDHEQLRTREDLYRELRAAFTRAVWDACPHEDRGDGVLIVIPPELPKRMVLGEILLRLDRALGGRRRSDPLLRLRVAAHIGQVHRDAHGVAGTAVNHVFRLCDSAPLRRALDSARSDVALLVSDAVYDTVVRGAQPAIDAESFCEVEVLVKETEARAWLNVPGDPATAPGVAREAAARSDSEGERRAATAGVSVHADGDFSMSRSMIAGHGISVARGAGKWWRRR
ncbi:adenylate/guanylate cyclase [Streptomyces apocyni]|uniref:adenylate/guanylate cyclase n=1 Tax=Streptomyces apocyni TaxID=2654677 RepID=UPI0012E9BD80|nr:adenylate/guanylate cyclase [Streptomyces apocyni]